MTEAGDYGERFREFRDVVHGMAEASAREAERHLQADEASFEFPFHDGETGSIELALDYLDEVMREGSPISANRVEEAYLSLLLSYRRMKGSVAALERVVRTMRDTFDLPDEQEIEQG
jgi:hypothetical protein